MQAGEAADSADEQSIYMAKQGKAREGKKAEGMA
jgi:hypothetical protein